jgi:ribosomal protein S27E
MTNVVNMNDRKFVRFFAEPIECEDCGKDTRGYVYEGSQQIICSHCRGVMVELERARITTEMVIVFTPEGDDGES